MRAYPESLLLLGIGLMNLLLAFGLAAIRTKPKNERALPLEGAAEAS